MWKRSHERREQEDAEFQATEPVDCVSGPLETSNGQLVLRIPLRLVGPQLAECTRGISRVDGDHLLIAIPNALSLAATLTSGMVVTVGRKGRKFAMWLPEQAEAVRTRSPH